MSYIPPMIPNLILAPTRYNLIYPPFANAPVWGYRLDKRAKNEFHWHTYTQIWYTLRGSYYHTVNGKRILLEEGDAAIILPYSVHAVDTSEEEIDNTDIITVYISRELWEKQLIPFFPLSYNTAAYKSFRLPALFHFRDILKERADACFKNISREFSKNSEMDETLVLQSLEDFLSLCTLNSGEQISENEISELREQYMRIYDAVEYITHNFAKKLPLQTLSKISLMSERSFTDKFKATTGMTYHSYLKAVRISEAVTKLRDGEDSIFKIARECGFSNSGHFINTCAHMCGLSPAKLRLHLFNWIETYNSELKNNRPFKTTTCDEE